MSFLLTIVPSNLQRGEYFPSFSFNAPTRPFLHKTNEKFTLFYIGYSGIKIYYSNAVIYTYGSGVFKYIMCDNDNGFYCIERGGELFVSTTPQPVRIKYKSLLSVDSKIITIPERETVKIKLCALPAYVFFKQPNDCVRILDNFSEDGSITFLNKTDSPTSFDTLDLLIYEAPNYSRWKYTYRDEVAIFKLNITPGLIHSNFPQVEFDKAPNGLSQMYEMGYISIFNDGFKDPVTIDHVSRRLTYVKLGYKSHRLTGAIDVYTKLIDGYKIYIEPDRLSMFEYEDNTFFLVLQKKFTISTYGAIFVPQVATSLNDLKTIAMVDYKHQTITGRVFQVVPIQYSRKITIEPRVYTLEPGSMMTIEIWNCPVYIFLNDSPIIIDNNFSSSGSVTFLNTSTETTHSFDTSALFIFIPGAFNFLIN